MVADKHIVFMFGHSPRYDNQLENLIEIIKNQIEQRAKIKVVLIHDGVIGTSSKGRIPLALNKLINLPILVYAMIPDLLARGINPNTIIEPIKLLNYDDLVDILVESPRIASWM